MKSQQETAPSPSATNRIPVLNRLQMRMILAFLGLAFVPAAVMGTYAYNEARRGYEAQVGQTVVGLAHLAKGRLVDAFVSADRQVGTWTTQREAINAPQLYGQTFSVFVLQQKRFRAFLTSQRQTLPIFGAILCVRRAEQGPDDRRGALVMFADEERYEGKVVLDDFWVKTEAGWEVDPRYRWERGQHRAIAPMSSPLDPAVSVLPIARQYVDANGEAVALVGFIDWREVERLLAETQVGGQNLRDLAATKDTYVFVVGTGGTILGGLMPRRRSPPATPDRW